MGRTKEEIKVGAHVFGQAANILNAVAEAALKADEFAGKKNLAQNIIPTIVLKAFSCELFLKSLVITGKIKKDHELDKLFNNLSQNDKDSIKERVVNAMKNSQGTYDENNFNTDLNNIANAFVDWRYFYENPKTINLDFLNNLFTVLCDYTK